MIRTEKDEPQTVAMPLKVSVIDHLVRESLDRRAMRERRHLSGGLTARTLVKFTQQAR